MFSFFHALLCQPCNFASGVFNLFELTTLLFTAQGLLERYKCQAAARTLLSPNVKPPGSAQLRNAFDVGVEEIIKHKLTLAQTA